MIPIYCARCRQHIADYRHKPELGMLLKANDWFWLDGSQPKGGEKVPPCPKCGASLQPTFKAYGA